MKILLTGATGYIGKRLLTSLVQSGHEVVCGVRDPQRMAIPNAIKRNVSLLKMDLLDPSSLLSIPIEIDVAYYLVHSMSSHEGYQSAEEKCAINFKEAISKTRVKQVIYLSGIVNSDELSEHLTSRLIVEQELSKGNYHLTTLRSGIIIGSGSASFEIIRDLVEKLPIMIAPRWLNTRCQPIGIRDVINLLTGCLGNEETYDANFDIGGPQILTYKEMRLGCAKERGLKRYIYTVPIMTPKLSSYWLYFVTSTSYMLASALVESMKVEVVCRDSKIFDILNIQPATYAKSLQFAFARIENDSIASSWKDSAVSGRNDLNLSEFVKVPKHGCFIDRRSRSVSNFQKTRNKIWSIGGKNGWYAYNWLWRLRGYIDKLFGGVGLRRGRTNQNRIETGDALDFWRVLYSNHDECRLLLFAEMKLPGEAWLDFQIKDNQLIQTATFRPRGLMGRLYWYSVFPFHGFIFSGMIDKLVGE
ncbi:MAG: hypothetical protein ACJA1A_001435 [Saprospiraceae bacterium]|jgi:uncharacterized protein YbjT (DUF2867 family)